MTSKRKISISLDPELVDELEAQGVPLSSQINRVLSDELARRRRSRLLKDLLGEMDHRVGKVDEALIEKYEELLR
ncbi:MAG: type II toxin-antitoxin system CcdA family antitoxin [Actinomycetota bacterium]